MLGKLGVCVTVCWVPSCGGTKQSFFRFILWQLNVSFHFLNLVTSRRWQLLQQISNALSSIFSVFAVAASMKNYLTWQSSTEGEPVLHVNVELNVALEVNTWEIYREDLQLQTVAAVHNQELGYKVFKPFDYSPEVAISYSVFPRLVFLMLAFSTGLHSPFYNVTALSCWDTWQCVSGHDLRLKLLVDFEKVLQHLESWGLLVILSIRLPQ